MRSWGLIATLSLMACGLDDANESKGSPDASDSGIVDVRPLLSLGRLTVDDRFYRDEQGRAVILRGVNARVDGLFDVSFDDGRVALEHVPELSSEDCERMAELGMHFVRLPLSWSGIEPRRDEFDADYLSRIDGVANCLREHGIYTMLDLHQDAYSKEIGEDGAPLWAIVPKPEKLLEGPLGDSLTERRFSRPVLAAFESFFAEGDVHGLQAEYIEMLAMLAKRYADDDAILGIDLFNEPVTSAELLAPFNERAARAVREAAPDMVVIFEPTGLWGQRKGEPVKDKSLSVASAMYAPHIYDLVIGGTQQQLENLTREDVEPSFRAATQEAHDWGTPWMIGEFGAGPSVTNYQNYLTLLYDLQDEYLVSSALWLWKEDSQGKWGMFERRDEAWTERDVMVELVSRPYAFRVAGTPTLVRFADGELVVRYDDGLDLPSVLYIPERFGVESVRCDGAPVDAERGKAGLVEVSCGASGAHEISVRLVSR